MSLPLSAVSIPGAHTWRCPRCSTHITQAGDFGLYLGRITYHLKECK